MTEQMQPVPYYPEEIDPSSIGTPMDGSSHDPYADDIALDEDHGQQMDYTPPADEEEEDAYEEPENGLEPGTPYKRFTWDIDTASIGIIYLSAKVNGEEYMLPCTSVSYQMAVNQIPVATVMVGSGRDVREPDKTYEPEKLLLALENRDAKEAVHDMLPCELYEEKTDGWGFHEDTVIFRGFIATGSPVYSASAGRSATQIQFNCYGLAAKLMTAPVAAYVESYVGVVMERYRRTMGITADNARKKHLLYLGDLYGLDQIMKSKVMTAALDQPIAKQVAACVAAVRTAASWIEQKDEQDERNTSDIFDVDPDDEVLSVLGGITELKTESKWGNGIVDACKQTYQQQLAGVFLTRMEQSSIWDTIVSSLTSDVFMLQLLPRWFCDSADGEPDFKMEVSPCTAWKPRQVIPLSAGDIVSFQMQHSSLASLNTPDVVLVQFKDTQALLNPQVAKNKQFGPLGVACRDEKLQEKLRNASKYDVLSELVQETLNCRVKEIAAPQWLGVTLTQPGAVDQGTRDNTGTLAVEHTPEKTTEETGGPQDPASQPSLRTDTGTSIYSAADAIARTLFLYYFMAGDVVSLELLPDCRFGLKRADGVFLENSLGDTVEVDLADSIGHSSMKLRGVLTAVSYQYAAGQASTAQYRVTLTRVRLADAVTPDEECPIYTQSKPYKEAV